MKKIIILLILIFNFVMPASSKEFMDKALNSWIGYPIDSVITCLGSPSDEKFVGTKHLYHYRSKIKSFVPLNDFLIEVEKEIFISFEVDSDNKVIGYKYSGDALPKTYKSGKHYVNPKNNQWENRK